MSEIQITKITQNSKADEMRTKFNELLDLLGISYLNLDSGDPIVEVINDLKALVGDGELPDNESISSMINILNTKIDNINDDVVIPLIVALG